VRLKTYSDEKFNFSKTTEHIFQEIFCGYSQGLFLLIRWFVWNCANLYKTEIKDWNQKCNLCKSQASIPVRCALCR